MVNNGFISFITETGGGFDANRNPIPATKVNSIYVPCNTNVVTREYRVYSDGQFKQAQYSVYVDSYLIRTFDLSALKEIELQDKNGVNLGKFQVQNKETLVLSGQLKIVV
jgi:hypothetical protein